MPDIQMCDNRECPLRSKCRRNPDSGTKPHDYWQAWGEYDHEGCTDFMPVDQT